MEAILTNYAKEGIFLALFLYLLIWSIPRLQQEFKRDMENMEERHDKEIQRLEERHLVELKKVEDKSEKREFELMRLLSGFGDTYKNIETKVDQVLKKLEK